MNKIMAKEEGSLLKNPFIHSSKLNMNQVQTGITALLKVIEKSKENKMILLDEDEPIYLQISCFKVPQMPSRFARLTLSNPLISKDSEVCLIVSDTINGRMKRQEDTVEYYEKLLEGKGKDLIKTIIPLHELRTEYGTFEAKRKLVELYDLFLVEGRISTIVTRFLGKIFVKKRKVPIPVKIQGKKLNSQLYSAISKSLLHLHSKGDSYIMPIGNSSFPEYKIVENILSVVEQMDGTFPGGWDNVSRLNLKTDHSLSIPIYVNLKNKNELDVPIEKPKRPKLYKPVTDELSTFYKSEVTVYPSGEVEVKHDVRKSTKK